MYLGSMLNKHSSTEYVCFQTIPPTNGRSNHSSLRNQKNQSSLTRMWHGTCRPYVSFPQSVIWKRFDKKSKLSAIEDKWWCCVINYHTYIAEDLKVSQRAAFCLHDFCILGMVPTRTRTVPYCSHPFNLTLRNYTTRISLLGLFVKHFGLSRKIVWFFDQVVEFDPSF